MAAQESHPPTLCRDCGHEGPFSGAKRCPTCGSTRLLTHQELFDLSIAHVDCDAFFAAIEKRDAPELAEKPVIVGGGKRGVVSTCCYIARTYGIRSAMPMFKALQLCPHAAVVKPTYEKYKVAADHIREEMDLLTPLVQPISIDEAFLDLTGTNRLHHASPAAVLAQLARKIESRVGISISIGLSHNKFLAKIASDFDKPRGFAVIGKEETLSFLADKPPSFIFGVGKSFEQKLIRDGYPTLGEVQKADPREMIRQYGEHGYRIWQLSRGEDRRAVNPTRETKSVSGETTFHEDLNRRNPLEDHLYRMSQKVSRRAKDKGLAGRVVTLKLKTSKFKSLTRRQTLERHTNLAQIIFEEGRRLLYSEEPSSICRTAYRLIGIGISDLIASDGIDDQFLFSDDHKRIGRRESAVDALRARYGDQAIGTIRDFNHSASKETRKDTK